MKNNNNKKLSTHVYFQVEDILYKKDNVADIKVTIKCKEKIVKVRLNNNKPFCISYKKYGKKKILDDDKKWIKILKKSIHKQLKKSSFKKLFIITLNDNVDLNDLENLSDLEINERLTTNTYTVYADPRDMVAFIEENDSMVKYEESNFIEVPPDELEQIEDINENIEDTESRSIKYRSRSLKEPYMTRIGDSNVNNNNDYPRNLYVFVLDTGIYEHADLNINKELSMDFTESDIGWSDRNGHGTHVAGSIGAKNSNFAVAPGVQLIAHKVLGDNGRGSTDYLISSLDEIKKFKDKNPSSNIVVNMSLGKTLSRSEANSYSYVNGEPTRPPVYSEFEKQIQNLIEKYGITFIIAAGNSTVDTSVSIPARVPEAITVGAYVYSNNPNNPRGSNNTIANFSNFGSLITIMAPGVDIYSTWHGYVSDQDTKYNTVYDTISGTSMAAPIVTGAVVNMIKAESDKNPPKILTPSKIKQRLQNDSKNSYLNKKNEKISMKNNLISLCWRNPPSNFDETDCRNWWFNTNNLQKTYPYSLYIGKY
jgi:subtilisin family serine protease